MPDSSTKRLEVYRGRKEVLNGEQLRPGTTERTWDFVQLWILEVQLAAYATYTRRGEFRRFAMSAWILEPYVQAFTGRCT
jgi:hypothetical protein